MPDFTQQTYHSLLDSLRQSGYAFQTFAEFMENPAQKVIITRHDIDALKHNALQIAQIQHSLGIKGSYFFRIIPSVFDEEIIRKIATLGHEIGYHYEDLTLAGGDMIKAYDSFCHNLEKLRSIYPVKTICMHGSPMSKYDSRDLWKHYDYKKLGIIGEPYFDIDFSKVLYLTDTGRRWDGEKVSVRDKILSSKLEVPGSRFRHTIDIIEVANKGVLPGKIMLTIHPQRWSDNYLAWIKELAIQNVKNIVKFYIVRK